MLIDTNDPNVIGEYLRDQFFDQSKGKGCYDTFDVRDDVTELPVEYDYDERWYVYEKDVNGTHVIMKWYWDGDGTLEFYFDDGTDITNDDCKKSHTWSWNSSYWNRV